MPIYLHSKRDITSDALNGLEIRLLISVDVVVLTHHVHYSILKEEDQRDRSSTRP